MVCSINRQVVTPRLEAQHPLTAPDNKTHDPKAQNEENPRFRPQPCRKRFCPRDDIIDAFAKAVAARRQRFFVLTCEHQRFFRRRGNGPRLGRVYRKTAVINVFCGNRRRRA
jgi:hypothetical protein